MLERKKSRAGATSLGFRTRREGAAIMTPNFDPIGIIVTTITLLFFVLDIWDEVHAERSTGETFTPLRAASTAGDSGRRSGGS